MRKGVVGIVAGFVIVVVAIGLVIWQPLMSGTPAWYNPGESLPHLTTPGSVPGDSVDPIVVGNLSLSVSGEFYTISPHYYPSTFDFSIEVSVNNSGSQSVDDFNVVKVTMFDVNATAIYTFGVIPSTNYTIQAHTAWVNTFSNDRDVVENSFIGLESAFARVLVTFDGDTHLILTTPLALIWHAIE